MLGTKNKNGPAMFKMISLFLCAPTFISFCVAFSNVNLRPKLLQKLTLDFDKKTSIKNELHLERNGIGRNFRCRLQAKVQDGEPNSSLATLTDLADLTKHLDNLLEQQEDTPREHNSYSSNPEKIATTEAPSTTFEILVIPGKCLQRDQMTVEYAARIREAANLLKNNAQKPDLICFTGGISGKNAIPDSSAGFSFFRTMCEVQKISLDGIQFFVDMHSTRDLEAVHSIIDEVTRSEDQNSKEQDLHFTILSQEYHLAQIADVDSVSRQQSLLKAITDIGGSYSFRHASYPFIFTHDESTSFMAKTYLIVEELVPFSAHLRGVGLGQEFFQTEQYNYLLELRRQINDQVAVLHTVDSPPQLLTTEKALRMQRVLPPEARDHWWRKNEDQTDTIQFVESPEQEKQWWEDPNPQKSIRLRSIQKAESDSVLIDESLEASTAILSEISAMIRPVVNLESSVSLAQWKYAADLLESAINCMRNTCDPDRPLTPREWTTLITGATASTEEDANNNRSTVQTPMDILGLLQLKNDK